MNYSEEIQDIKNKMGEELCILAHHYERDEVVQHADFVGDSLELAKKVSALDANYIIMCGVYFMAETTRILARESQKVYIPVEGAGCTLADLAPSTLVEIILSALNKDRKIIPLAYVNTSAKVKALCGKFGGSVCTSANSVKMLRWAMENSDGVLFLPDRNLGVNTANELGIGPEEISFMEDNIFDKRYKLYIWPGLCDVHVNFRVQHIEELRKTHPRAKVIVHPECPPDVVNCADEWGSTSKIIKYVKLLPENSEVIIGTEINLVQRLKKTYPQLHIYPLMNSSCKYMAMIDEKTLLNLLKNISSAKEIIVDTETKKFAHKAISKMLHICS